MQRNVETDKKGHGNFILQDLCESWLMSHHDQTLQDGFEIEANVLADEQNGAVSPLKVSVDGFGSDTEIGLLVP